jgi:Gas vesicle synthesis protein GvpL/GvpF
MSTKPETATYVYCLVERARRPPMARVPAGVPGAAAPELVEVFPQLWAIAADVPLAVYGSEALAGRLKDINWVADAAVAHESVVEHFAAARETAVVPMKLFTMFSSRDRAVADLCARRDEVRSILKRIRGCHEWGVRVTKRAVSPPRRAAAQKPTSGTAFLAARKRARDDARDSLVKAAEAAERAYLTLARLARASERRDAPREATAPPLVDAAFLVAAEKRGRFRAAAVRSARACRESGADLVLTGPWPAYSFVQNRV